MIQIYNKLSDVFRWLAAQCEAIAEKLQRCPTCHKNPYTSPACMSDGFFHDWNPKR